LELVRYIHLNPIRAKLVSDIKALDKYAFSGHSVIMGKVKRHWQDFEWVLGLFDDRLGAARRRYKAFVAKGISEGRRDDLTGGGLIRSHGGWAAVKQMRKAKMFEKSDERILGDGDFVEQVLSAAELWAPGKERKRVAARSLLCYWAVRDLGIGMAQIARRLNLSLAGVSQSVKRGETIVQQKGYNLIDP